MKPILNERQPWDVTLTTCGEKRLAALLRAMIITGSHFTCSFTIGDALNLPWTHSVFFRVWVSIDCETEDNT